MTREQLQALLNFIDARASESAQFFPTPRREVEQYRKAVIAAFAASEPVPAVPRWRIKSDDDGHYYLIPADREDDWWAWVQAPDADPEGPPWARRIDGPHRLTFSDPREE